MRVWTLAVLVGMTAISAAPAQTAGWQFRWQPGQVLSYRAEHITAVAEVVDGKKVETSSKLTLVKRWQVLSVDPVGTATLQLSLTAMRNEQKRPDGEVVLYDSADPDKSTKGLREHLEKFLNKPLAVLKVDSTGKVVEVQSGSANRYDAEPPFIVTLPAAPVAVGQGWERTYKVTLDPPQGTGEQYDAVQKYVCKKTTGGVSVFAVTTSFTKLPENLLERVPLLQKQAEGEVVFDLQAGRIQSADLRIDKELRDHQGVGSSYRFESTYSERYVESK